jgi:PAS domain S-box-containing protein
LTPANPTILVAMARAKPDSGATKTPAATAVRDGDYAITAELAGLLLDAIHEGVIIFDKDARAVYCNRSWAEVTGATLAQRQALSDEEFVKTLIHEDGTPMALEDLPSAKVLRTGKSLSITHGRVTPAGTIWIDLNGVPLRHADTNELFGCCLVMRDATARKNADAELRASEELKSAVMAASVDAIITIDNAGKIIDLNRAAERLYKTTRTAVGENLEAFIPWRDREAWTAVLRRLQADPEHFRGRRLTGTGQRSDGSEFPLEATIDSLDGSGHPFIVVFIRDDTEHRAAERRLADARDAALRASVVKSEFLATMSHEIRTPMNGVIGSLDLILDSDIADELRELATIARTSAHDLLAIINDILDLSKIEADKLDSQEIEFDLAAVVEGVTDIVAVPARHKGLSLSCFVDPRAPAAVRGDARLLRQVLVNLVGNAVKFTDAGEVAIRAEVQPSADDQVVVQFGVSDTGIGIPPEATEKLFEPFTQVDGSSTRAHGGTGLGLAISARLVRLMGGKLAVASGVGRGSTFSFTVPFELSDPASGPAYTPSSLGRVLRVLVVESSPSAAEAIERYLRAWGMQTARANTANEGLECYDAAHGEDRFDVAMVEVSAEDDTGFRLARELHAHAAAENLFVIALVGLGERLTESGGDREHLFDAVLAKPIKQGRLFETIASIGSAPPAREAAGGNGGTPDLHGLRILIAEDNPVNQQVLMRQATRLGLIATAVANGEEALAAFAGGQYDAVLMDCQMPVMDGYEAARAIREREHGRGAHTPIVAVTANAMREDFERCRDAGMDDFVAKPVTLAALTSAIERAVLASRADPGTPEQPAKPKRRSRAAPADDFGVDRGALAALQEDVGGAGALARIVRLFLEQLDPQTEQIEQAARAGELESLARTAHRMKSSSATLGATTLADVLNQLEAAGREGDPETCRALTASLVTAVARARKALEDVTEGLEAAN